MIELNNGQIDAVKKSKHWWTHQYKQTFKISGPPGSGKTTIINCLLDEIKLNIRTDVLFVTYVGRASIPLRMNGLLSRTIHSTIYEIEEDYVYDSNGVPRKSSNGKYLKTIKFVKRDKLPKHIKLIVVDEAPMVPDVQKEDLESFGRPIIALGDKDQLPPVFGKSSFLDNPDVVLTEIMRQKQGDPILHLAFLSKAGKDLPLGQYGKRCFVVEKDILEYDWVYKKFNTIITGKNKTRESINYMIRHDIRGVDDALPVKYDKLVCRKNNWLYTIDDGNVPLINGLVGKVTEIYPETYNGRSMCVDFQPDFLSHDYFEQIELDCKYLNLPYEYKQDYRYGEGNRFDSGYALTTHLVQGSQFDSIMYIQEMMGSEDFQRKLDYTAITRAKETLMIVKKKKKKKFFW